MTEGNRLDVFFVHPNRGKRMVYGAKTQEKLGYIGYGSFISNVHETDIAARSADFICGVCQKPFTVIRETAYCQQDFPPTQAVRPQLGSMRPRSLNDRISATGQRNQQQPQQPWQAQGYDPNAGFNQQAPPPPPPQQQAPLPPREQPSQQERQPVFDPPAPEPPPPPSPQGAMDDPASAVAAARQQKEQSFGIPVIEPGEIGPPPNLSQPVPEPSPSPELIPVPSPMTKARIVDIDFGRSVNARHKKTLSDNGINTLYDAMKAGNTGLESINGIGAGVSSAVMIEVDKRLAT